MTSDQWDGLSLEEQEKMMRDKVFVIVGSGDYRGIKGFKLHDWAIPQSLDDLDEEDLTPEKIKAHKEARKAYDDEVRRRLQHPTQEVIHQVLDLLNLDDHTSREVQGEFLSANDESHHELHNLDMTKRGEKVAASKEGIKLFAHAPLSDLHNDPPSMAVNWLVLGGNHPSKEVTPPEARYANTASAGT